MIEPFLNLCRGFIFPIFPPLLDGFATRSAPTRLFASQVDLFVLLVNSTQLSREAYLRQSPT